ncbi:indolepyruvate ferredoxin oxidoreductase family protein [Corynebacterium hansenii]|uniref:Indolepyruvate ferredoxin oxidoreductase family protein n=1 Tax=Corynebacterium hansenii TaxID=394964 RepID=A0ABV7ZTW7_9CORY|nr:indolepyruvate ferredoxin oxidoreductase family protein [Corynebacterium hansenii]WJY99990.1 NADH-dependent phenylglyoxylate dehydrogenase subunit gamma [Corynebacterium hansenii]
MTTMLPPTSRSDDPNRDRAAGGTTTTAPARPADDTARPGAARRDIVAERLTADKGTVHLTGIQALVRTVRDRALADRARGLKTASFISGYEGSPLGGYDLELARRKDLLDALDVVHLPAVNEELGATSVSGSQLAAGGGTLREGVDGVVGYWYGKAPGLDRSVDALRHANLSGTSPTGGAVAIVGDDPFAKSSTVPSSSERLLADIGMPVLVPADAAEVVKLGIHAAWMSRESGLWTALRVTAAVADGSATVTLDGPPVAPAPPADGHSPSARTLGPTLHELEASRVGVRLDRARAYARDRGLNRFLHVGENDRLGIVCAGAPALAVEEALRTLGSPEGVRVLRLGMTWPLDPEQIEDFATGLDSIIVVEDKGTFLLESVQAALYETDRRPRLEPARDPAAALPPVLDRLGISYDAPVAEPIRRRSLPLSVPARTPHFCSGCPHNASTRVTGDSLVGAGIGCHAMVLLMDENRVGDVTGTTQMGGEGAHWIGMSPFVRERHLVQNLGDGTFFHSGSLAVRALVASGVDVTLKLLHNGTVAMTGGQDPVGQMPLAGILELLRAEGVGRIVVTTDDVARTRKELGGTLRTRVGARAVEIRDRADLADVQRELAAESGVTVLVHDQSCATELRRARKRGKAPMPTKRIVINERICEGCGDCGEKSGCLSVQPVDTEFGRKTRIDQTTCNLDYSCIQGDCPAFTEVTVDPDAKKTSGPAGAGARVAPLDDADLPAPPPAHIGPGRSWNVRVTGVGGTGVVMLAAVIAAAAREDGRHVRGVDMTGLAQKGGAVVSDVRITDGALEQSGLVPAGAADLLLACDGLTSADPANLGVINPRRTTAVVSSTSSPTGVMCTDVKAERPDGVALAGAIGRSAARAVTTDAAAVALGIFGDATVQTTLLLGAAVQSGSLPVSPEAVERALRSNGIAVDANIQAFRRGRQLVAAPEAIAALLKKGSAAVSGRAEASGAAAAPAWAKRLVDEKLGTGIEGGLPVELPADLRDSIALRVAELKEWGDESDALGYVDDLAVLAGAERSVAPRSTALLRAASFGLHKLTAYKDEYEVARLALDTGFLEDVAGEYGADADVKILLHPPVLRALGWDSKIRMGKAARPALRALTKAKHLRGTALDPFGRMRSRRFERELRDAYRTRLLGYAAEMNGGADDVAKQKLLSDATALAALADVVRGYEDVKERSARPLIEALGMTVPK